MSILSSLTNLIPGVAQIKTAFAIGGCVMLLGGVGYVWYTFHEVGQLKQTVAEQTVSIHTYQTNQNVLTTNYNVCHASNVTNQATITALIAERNQAQIALQNLSNQNLSDTKTLADLQSKLNQMEKDPKNNGTLSQDLIQAIAGIQGATQ